MQASHTHSPALAGLHFRLQVPADTCCFSPTFFLPASPLPSFCLPCLLTPRAFSAPAQLSAGQRIATVANALGIDGFARIDAFVHSDTGEVRALIRAEEKWKGGLEVEDEWATSEW